MSRLKFLSCVILSSFVAISAAYAEGEEAIPAQTEPESLQDVVTGNTPTEATITSMGVCGENLFNPQLLSESDFNVTISNGTMSAVGKWNQYVNAYVSAYNFGFKPGKKYKVTYTIKCGDTETGTRFLGLKLADNTVVGPTNVCAGQTGDKLVSYWYDSSVSNPVVGMVAGGEASEEEITLQNVMVTEAEMSTSSYIPYLACIKVASKLSTDNRAAVVENRLNDVRSVITNLIGQMETNTTNILSLNNAKQTRPATACDDGKKCLLVKDTNGGNHWYEIQDCNEDDFLDDVGTMTTCTDCGAYVAGMRYANGGNGKMCEALSSTAAAGCDTNEWATSFANNTNNTSGIIYGTARTVPIAERNVGTVVELSSATLAMSGNVCVCQATRYVSNGVETVLPESDKWMVAKVMTGTFTNDNCLEVCAHEDQGVSGSASDSAKYAAYFKNISSSCSPNAQSTTTCNYNSFLRTLYDGLDSGLVSISISSQGTNGLRVYGSCGTGGSFASDTDICGTSVTNPGAWVVGAIQTDALNGTLYSSVYNGALVYGKSRCVSDSSVFDNVADFDVVKLDSAPAASNSGTVCLHNITGYKPANGSKTATSAESQKYWIVKKYATAEECNAENSTSGCYGEGWTESYLRNGNFDFYGKVGDACLAN